MTAEKPKRCGHYLCGTLRAVCDCSLIVVTVGTTKPAPRFNDDGSENVAGDSATTIDIGKVH